jgi:putative lipoprotein
MPDACSPSAQPSRDRPAIWRHTIEGMSATHILAVAGTVLFRERIALPPGGVVTVKLVDTAGEVLAGTSVDAENGPTAFSLQADPADAADPTKLLLWARLRSEAGVWGTTELVPVADDSTQVVVTRIDA